MVSIRDGVHSGWYPLGMVSIGDGVHLGLMSIRDRVHSGLCPFGLVSIQNGVHSGNCPDILFDTMICSTGGPCSF